MEVSGKMEKYRAVFHLNEDSDSRVAMVFNNIQNLLSDLGKNQVEVELVANGTGVNALLKANSVTGERIQQLTQEGVQFAVCANSMETLKLKDTALLDHVRVVPSGIGELVRRQAEGWAYIRH